MERAATNRRVMQHCRSARSLVAAVVVVRREAEVLRRFAANRDDRPQEQGEATRASSPLPHQGPDFLAWAFRSEYAHEAQVQLLVDVDHVNLLDLVGRANDRPVDRSNDPPPSSALDVHALTAAPSAPPLALIG